MRLAASSHPLPTALASDPHARGHHVLVVTRSHSTATVIWQDGTTTTASTPSFEHCVNIDEDVDVFPGDVGIFSVTNRVGVVQSMESKKRTVKLRWLGTDESEVVSGLEFDPHGPPPEVYGVRRQDFVLVANGSNGVPVPTVPRLGESEILTGQFPSVEGLRVEVRSLLFSLRTKLIRTQLSAIGLDQASRLGDAPAPLPQTGSSLSSIDWYGEVIDLLLDGQVLVRFPSGATAALPLDRIYHLDDGLDPDAMMGGEPFADDDASMSGASAGSWETDGGEEFEGDEEMEEVGEMGWAEEEEVVEVVRETEKVLSGSGGEEKKEEGVSMPAEVEEHESWQRFMMLEQAPQVSCSLWCRRKGTDAVRRIIIIPTSRFRSRPRRTWPASRRNTTSSPPPYPVRLSPLLPAPLTLSLLSQHPRARLRESIRPPSVPHHRTPRDALPERSVPLRRLPPPDSVPPRATERLLPFVGGRNEDLAEPLCGGYVCRCWACARKGGLTGLCEQGRSACRC